MLEINPEAASAFASSSSPDPLQALSAEQRGIAKKLGQWLSQPAGAKQLGQWLDQIPEIQQLTDAVSADPAVPVNSRPPVMTVGGHDFSPEEFTSKTEELKGQHDQPVTSDQQHLLASAVQELSGSDGSLSEQARNQDHISSDTTEADPSTSYIQDGAPDTQMEGSDNEALLGQEVQHAPVNMMQRSGIQGTDELDASLGPTAEPPNAFDDSLGLGDTHTSLKYLVELQDAEGLQEIEPTMDLAAPIASEPSDSAAQELQSEKDDADQNIRQATQLFVLFAPFFVTLDAYAWGRDAPLERPSMFQDDSSHIASISKSFCYAMLLWRPKILKPDPELADQELVCSALNPLLAWLAIKYDSPAHPAKALRQRAESVADISSLDALAQQVIDDSLEASVLTMRLVNWMRSVDERGTAFPYLLSESSAKMPLAVLECLRSAGLCGRLWRQSSVVLDVAVERILHTSPDGNGAIWAAERPRFLTEILPGWLLQFNYRPSEQSCLLIQQAFGPVAAMAPINILLQVGRAAMSNKDRSAALNCTAVLEAYVRVMTSTALRCCMRQLEQVQILEMLTESKWQLLDSNYASLWMGLSRRLGFLMGCMQGPSGDSRAMISNTLGSKERVSMKFSDSLPQWNHRLLRATLARLMLDVTEDDGDLSAVVAAALMRVHVSWCPTLARAAFAALPRLNPERRMQILKTTYVWEAAGKLVAQMQPKEGKKQAEGGKSGGAVLLELLHYPEALEASAIVKQPSIQDMLEVGISTELNASRRPAAAAPASPDAVSCALGLLKVAGLYKVHLPALTYDAIILAAAAVRQADLCISSIMLFLMAGHLTSASLKPVTLQALIRAGGVAAVEQLLIETKGLPLPRRTTLTNDLILSGAMARNEGCCLTAVRWSCQEQLPISPQACSAVAEAFLPVQNSPQPELHERCLDGIRAAEEAFVAIAGNLTETAEQRRSPASSISGSSSNRKGSSSSNRRKSSSSSNQRISSSSSSSSKHQLHRLLGLSDAAAHLVATRLATSTLQTSGDGFSSLRHLALDLAPKRVVAQLLLALQGGAAVPPPSGQLLQLVLLGAQERWQGLSAPALAALHKLDSKHQQEALKEGGAAALASMLLTDAAASPSSSSALAPLLAFLERYREYFQAEGAYTEPQQPHKSEQHKRWQQNQQQQRQHCASWVRALTKQLLDVCDGSTATDTSQLALDARKVAELFVSAATSERKDNRGATQSGSSHSTDSLPETCWMIQEALVHDRTVRGPVSLSLAHHFFQSLQHKAWHLFPSCTAGAGAGNAELPLSSCNRYASGLFGADSVEGIAVSPLRLPAADPSLQHSATFKTYIELIAWMATKRPIGSDAFPAPGHPSKLPWLLQCVASLCSCLAASIGSAWARALPNTESLSFAARVCQSQSLHLPVVDCLHAYLQNQSNQANMPRELAEASMEAVADLEAWEEGGPLVRALDLGSQFWGEGKDHTSICQQMLQQLTAQQAQAALAILFNYMRGTAFNPISEVRAMTAIAELLLWAHGSALTPDTLFMILAARAEAARAAAEYTRSASAETLSSLSSEARQVLDFAHHCSEAREAVQQLVLTPYLSRMAQNNEPGLTQSHNDHSQQTPGHSSDVLVPSTSLYTSLMEVFASAGRPVEAVRLGMELATGALPVVHDQGVMDRTGLVAATSDHAVCSAIETAVAGAMAVANRARFFKGTVMLFKELLVQQGYVRHQEVMAQVISADELSEEALELSVLEPFGGDEGIFYQMQECCEIQDGAPCSALIPDGTWLMNEHRLRVTSQHRENWMQELSSIWQAQQDAAEQWESSRADHGVVEDEHYGDDDDNDDGVIITDVQASQQAGLHVALFGGMEFKDSDKQMLLGISPPGTCLHWFGSRRDVGVGNSEVKLVRSIKAGRLDKVYIQTRHNGHTGVNNVLCACRTHGVPFQMVSTNIKSLLKAQALAQRYQCQ